MKTAKELYDAYSGAVVPIVIIDNNGDEGIGSAFHVGSGVFVTARHVLDGAKSAYVLSGDKTEITEWFGHEDDAVDVACFRGPPTDTDIPLGGHLDDWIDDAYFVLSNVVVLGYPPIPMSNRPTLVASRGEINAVVDLYNGKHPRFVLSTVARGGFSGGVALSEWNFALGVITDSLSRNGEPAELGFFSVLTIEPIFECLHRQNMIPAEQYDFFGGNLEAIFPRKP